MRDGSAETSAAPLGLDEAKACAALSNANSRGFDDFGRERAADYVTPVQRRLPIIRTPHCRPGPSSLLPPPAKMFAYRRRRKCSAKSLRLP